MTVAARIARLNAATQRHWGESCTYYASGDTEGADCNAVIISAYDPLDFGGSTLMRERRLVALIDSMDLANEPQVGDVIVADSGARYRIDAPPEDEDGMWRVIVLAESES